MSLLRRLVVTVVVAALLAGTAYAVLWATRPGGPLADAQVPRASGADGAGGGDPGRVSPRRVERSDRQRPAKPTPKPDPEPTQQPTRKPPEPADPPEPRPGPALLAPGRQSPEVRELQARLRQIAWFDQDVTGYYGPVTTEAVRGFQAKRGFPVTGEVDQRTRSRLREMTTEPTEAELENRLGDTASGNRPGALDPRCTTGRVLCIDKSSRTLRWVVDGDVGTTVDVRFGAEETPTREGVFDVDFKSRDHVSSLYDTPMPYAMFFSGGQAVHYSPDFAADGYAGASHGCVNVRDKDAVAALFEEVQVGDKVVVYWS